MVVANRAFELGNGVHDEGAVADDGRIKRIAADQQQFAVLLHCYLQRVPGRKAGKLPRLDDLVGNCDLARHDIERKFMSTQRINAQCAAGHQTGVNHEGTAGCPNGTGDIADLSCNEAHRSVVMRQQRNLVSLHVPVGGFRMLSAFRHVDPQLHPVHPAARAHQGLVRRFVMDHTAACAHPLHLAWPHRADIAEAVLVHRPPFEEQGQSLDTGVRMSRGALGFARPHLDWTEMIQEDEGANGLEGG
ncbi:hypothetical protein ACVWXO_003569 [Bradyrhizobium sp. LM2.7]